jgi:tetratricopeptide (TPR) repeat protein
MLRKILSHPFNEAEKPAQIAFLGTLSPTEMTTQVVAHRFVTLMRLGRCGEALECLDMALDNGIFGEQGLVYRAITLTRLGRLAEARIAYTDSITINPKEVDAFVGRASVFRKLGRN